MIGDIDMQFLPQEETLSEVIPTASEDFVDSGGRDAIPDSLAAETGETPCSEGSSLPDRVITAKFNKRERGFTADEAMPYVEMGLKWESFKPSYERLRYLAQCHGEGVDEFLERITGLREEEIYRQALAEVGGNEEAARKLAAYQTAEIREKFAVLETQESDAEQQVVADERSALEHRLAEGFLELDYEMPGVFATFSDVPRAVVEMAAGRGITLYDAYLRYERQQAIAAEVERSVRKRAARQSTGSIGGSDVRVGDGYSDAFSAAFNRVF